MSLIHAYVDESMKLFPSGLNSKMLDGYFKAFVRFFNLPVLVEDSGRVPLEEFGRIFNLPALVEDSEKVRLEAVKSKYIDVLNEMGFADKLMLMEDPEMYIFQVIGCKYAENYHHCIKSGSFLCPFALFVGALIHSYMNSRIHISKTVLRRGGSITVYKKLRVKLKEYKSKPG